MVDELSLIRFSTINFFAVLLNSRPFNPIHSLLIKIVYALLQSEPTPDKEHKKRVDWIYEYTHTNVNESLCEVEALVFKNLDRGLNKELEIRNKTFLLAELYKYLDEIAVELTSIVIDIAKKYSIDIPITSFGMNKAEDNKQIIKI